MKNKKGQLLGLGIILVAVLIFLAIFFISSTFRFVTIGVSLIVASFLMLSNKDIKSQNIKVTLFLVLLGVGVVMVFSSSVIQSVLSSSTVTLKNGEPYWVFTGASSFTSETVTFNSRPSSYTLNDGTEYVPQRALDITISKDESYCRYLAREQSITQVSLSFPFYSKYDYWTLESPYRIVKLKVQDNRGNTKYLNAYEDSVVLGDSDGKGQATVESQGTTGSNRDCETGQNVAIIVNNGQTYILDKSLFLSTINQGAFTFTKVSSYYNDAFINSFDSEPRFVGNTLTGDLDLGKVIYTVTADANYFDSVVFEPKQAPIPSIQSIQIPEEIREGSSSSMRVYIKNNGDSGTLSFDVDTTGFEVSPNSGSLSISAGDTKSLSIAIKSGTSLGTARGTFEICGVSQFTSTQCDSESFNFNVVSSGTNVDVSCGDGVCSASESSNTCAIDCPIADLTNNDALVLECGFGEKLVVTNEEVGKGWFGIGKLVGLTDTVQTQECKPDDWVLWVFVALIILPLGFFAIYLNLKPKRRRR